MRSRLANGPSAASRTAAEIEQRPGTRALNRKRKLGDAEKAWASLCQALLIASEFRYVRLTIVQR